MSNGFNPDTYGPFLSKLLQEYRLFELGPGTPNESVRNALTGLRVENLFHSQVIRDEYMAQACLSAVWLYHDFLDESHTISQSIPSTTGSYWHGIMHRREPDYMNAKYWFHKFRTHPIFEPLARDAAALANGVSEAPAMKQNDGSPWDPFAFIDLCEAHCGKKDPLEELCRKIQRREWELLFDYCYTHAVYRE